MNIQQVSNTNFGMATIKPTKALKDVGCGKFKFTALILFR